MEDKEFNKPLHDANYHYSYKGDQNWKPGSELHKRILAMLLERAQAGHSVVSKRYSTWRSLDRILTSYVSLSEEEKKLKAADYKAPVSIVVPVSMAVLDTLLTYMTASFLNDPLFRYEPVGPEDVEGAALLELHINLQMIRTKAAVNLRTAYRDSFVYGMGLCTPIWVEKLGRVLRDSTDITPIGASKYVHGTMFQGHEIHNIDPYSFIPDPNVPTNEIQRGEFIGWVRRENRMELLAREKGSEGSLFNARYLKHTNGYSLVHVEDSGIREHGPMNDFTNRLDTLSVTNPVDVIYLYVNLIPEEWGLGSGAYPEKWIFAVAGDEIIIQAEKLGFNHDMFPVSVACPDTDGRSVCPISRLELTYGAQELVDFFVNSHVMNARKAVNDMFVVDPKRVNMFDVQNPSAGKVIRLREAAWGTSVKDAIMQFPVNDVTRQHMTDMTSIFDVIQRVTGASDILQGVQRKTSARVTATESRGVQNSAASRLAQLARMIGIQFHQDLGYLIASQTQQLANEAVFTRVVGRHAENLRKEYGNENYLSIDPDSLAVDFDVIPPDGTIPGQEDSQAWIMIFQTLMSNPEMAQVLGLDIPRVFKHMAKQLGAKNFEEFVNEQAQQPAQPAQMPMEQIQAQSQAGNIVPLQEYQNAMQ